jgi:hypothetical protein
MSTEIKRFEFELEKACSGLAMGAGLPTHAAVAAAFGLVGNVTVASNPLQCIA